MKTKISHSWVPYLIEAEKVLYEQRLESREDLHVIEVVDSVHITLAVIHLSLQLRKHEAGSLESAGVPYSATAKISHAEQ